MSRRHWVAVLTGAVSVACSGSDLGCGSARVPAREPSEPSLVHWEAPVDVAHGRAFAGPWQMNESNFDYVDDATVAMSDEGALVVGWVDNARKDVFVQWVEPDLELRSGAPGNVSNSPAIFSWLPRMVVSERQLWVLWQEIVFSGGSHGGEIFFSRSEDAGRTFSAPLNLSRSTGGDGKGRLSRRHWDNGSLDLVRDAKGTLLAAWTEYDGALWFASSADGGQSFSLPVRVAGSDQQPARGPSIADLPDGEVRIVWASGASGRGTLFAVASRDDGRTFSPPRSVVQSSGHVDAPKLVADERGELHLVYGENSGDAASPRVRYLRLDPSLTPLEAPRTLSDSTSTAGANFPSSSLAGPGRVVVAWLHHPNADSAPRGLALVWSRDGGERFSLPEIVPGTHDPTLGVSGSRQGKLMRLLAADRSGRIALASSHFREGQSSRIRVIVGRTP